MVTIAESNGTSRGLFATVFVVLLLAFFAGVLRNHYADTGMVTNRYTDGGQCQNECLSLYKERVAQNQHDDSGQRVMRANRDAALDYDHCRRAC